VICSYMSWHGIFLSSAYFLIICTGLCFSCRHLSLNFTVMEVKEGCLCGNGCIVLFTTELGSSFNALYLYLWMCPVQTSAKTLSILTDAFFIVHSPSRQMPEQYLEVCHNHFIRVHYALIITAFLAVWSELLTVSFNMQ